MSKEHIINITDGTLAFIHDDDIRALQQTGPTTTERVSEVEPHPTKLGWVTDMRRSGGPILGKGGTQITIKPLRLTLPLTSLGHDLALLPPFETRDEALAAEKDWLRKERGL